MNGSAASRPQVVNRLIASLSADTRNRILKHCAPVQLVFGAVLCEANEPLRHVFLSLTGFISLVAMVKDHPPLEIGLIGNEGLLGATLALDVTSARLRGIVQGPGTALRMSAAQLRQLLRENRALRRTINRYLFVLLAQQSRSIACSPFP